MNSVGWTCFEKPESTHKVGHGLEPIHTCIIGIYNIIFGPQCQYLYTDTIHLYRVIR